MRTINLKNLIVYRREIMQITLQKLSEFLIYFPILPFYIFPVQKWIISSQKRFLLKMIQSIIYFFLIAFFIIYFFQISDTNDLMIPIFGYFFWFYNKEISLSIYKKAFWFFTTCLLGSFSALFAIMVDAYINPHITYLDYSWLRILMQFLFIIIMDIIFYYPVKKYYTWIFDNYHNAKVWKFLWLFPIIFITISLFLIPQHFDFVLHYRYFKIYLCILIVFFMLIIIIYILMYRIIHSFVENQKMLKENQLLSIQANQYHQLLTYVKETRRIRHDFKHQMIILSELLNQKEYQKMSEYIHTSVSMLPTEIIQYSCSSAINAILSHYEALCKEKGIDTDFKVSLPDQLLISQIDLCVLLGNLLENAYDACQNTKQPFIVLKLAKTSPSILALKISNSYDGEIIEKNGQFISTKHKEEGLGIESIRVISKKYNGSTDIHYDQHTFSVKILLRFECN